MEKKVDIKNYVYIAELKSSKATRAIHYMGIANKIFKTIDKRYSKHNYVRQGM